MNDTLAEEEIKSGLTWKVMLALFAAVFLFIPVNIYSFFLTGIIQGSVAVFFITMLITELSRLSGAKLSKQEILLLYYATGWGAAAIPVYYYIIYRAYFVKSPLGLFYTICGRPIINFIPKWLAPPYNSPAYDYRTLFQPDFALPLFIFSLWSIIYLLIDLFMAQVSANIFVERLKYPFPFALVDSSVATFLGERKSELAKYFILSLLLGAIYGAAIYMPALTGGLSIIPIPFYDLTWALQEALPGGVLAILTTLSSYVTPMVMPFKMAIWIFLSSITIWIILNSLFVTTFPDIFPLWAKEYTKGMGLIAVQNRSYIRVWFGPQVGFVLAAIVYIFFFRTGKIISKALRELLSKEKASAPSELLSLSKALVFLITSMLIGVIFYYVLIPEVPLWFVIFYSLIFGFLMPIALTAFLGESGYAIPVPNMWPALVYLTSYTGFSAFVFSPPIGGGGSPGFSQQVKAAYMVRAKPFDLVKIWILGFILAQVSGLISIDFFWRVAPIPSSAYPYTVFNVISMAFNDAMLSTRQMTINFNAVIFPFLILLSILVAGYIIDQKNKFFSAIGLIMGLYLLPSSSLAILIGSFLSNYVIPKFIGGQDEWRSKMGYVIAGELTGEGLIIMLGVVINLIYKSSWIWPW